MNLQFFKKYIPKLDPSESLLVKKLHKTASQNNFSVFKDIVIYHHKLSYTIPLLLIDPKRGIFIFEHKDWSYNDLKNAKIEKASQQDKASNTLAFEKAHEIIRKKFNEINHNDGVPIFNFLIMDNLTMSHYSLLDESVHSFLPEEKIIFNDSLQQDIILKMTQRVTYNLPSVSEIMSTLLIQFAIVENNEKVYFASQEQREFINAPLERRSNLVSPQRSGKTSVILLKAILEKIRDPKLKIVIIKSNYLSCDILKRKLLDTIEHAIIEFDATSIQIITHESYYKNPPKNIDLLICDDSQSYSIEVMSRIKENQEIKYKIYVLDSAKDHKNTFFTKIFNSSEIELLFYETNQHAKALQLIAKLSKEEESESLLVVSNEKTRAMLKDDLNAYVNKKATLLDTSLGLHRQDFNSILLSTYDEICSLKFKSVIFMDVNTIDIDTLQYAYNLCSTQAYILYDENTQYLEEIRTNFENNKNSYRVARTT